MPTPTHYTDLEIEEDALKFETPTQWKSGSPHTYWAASSRGLISKLTSKMKKSKIKIGRPVVVGEVYYRTITEAARILNISCGNLSQVLCGKRASVIGLAARYATEAERASNGDTREYSDLDKDEPLRNRTRLILGHPLIDSSGKIYSNPQETANKTGLLVYNILYHLRKHGNYKGLRLATEEEIRRSGADPLNWAVFYRKKFPGYLPRRKKPSLASSCQTQ
jgi:hypothetical protein